MHSFFSSPGMSCEMSKNSLGNDLVDQVYDEALFTQLDYSTQGPPNCKKATTCTINKGISYDCIDNQHKTNTSQPGPANPSTVRDETSKKEGDAEEHTYEVMKGDRGW